MIFHTSRVVRAFACACLAGACLAPLRAEVAGWRSDGSGRYPDAQPPTQWAKDKNVLWATPLPDKSNATPVLIGDRLVCCAEPTTLLCVGLSDGKLLWQKTNTYEDYASAEDLAKMKDAQAQAAPIQQEISDLGRKLNTARQTLKTNKEDAEAKKTIEELNPKLEEAKKKLAPFSPFMLPGKHPDNGYSSSTPLWDGERIYVAFGTGTVACYDRDGNRQWVRRLENPSHESWGFCASPVLSAGKIIVHLAKLTALDPKTGQTAWSTPLQFSWGTPAPVQIGGTDVLLTAAGDAVRASDGKVLANRIGKLEFCAPIVQDGIAYFIQDGGKALKLPSKAEEPFKPEALWTAKIKNDRYYASPVIHEGLIYTVMKNGNFSVLDAKTGALVYEKDLALGPGTVYPSVAFAGKYIYASSDNGTTVVIEPGREYKELARNTLEPFRACPVFSGNKLYIRGQQKLYCITGQ